MCTRSDSILYFYTLSPYSSSSAPDIGSKPTKPVIMKKSQPSTKKEGTVSQIKSIITKPFGSSKPPKLSSRVAGVGVSAAMVHRLHHKKGAVGHQEVEVGEGVLDQEYQESLRETEQLMLEER